MQHTVVSLASSDAVAVEAFEQWNDHPPVGAEHLTEVAGGGRTAFAQAQQWAIHQAVAVPIFVTASLVGAAKKVQGLSVDPAGFPLFYDAWLAR